MDTKALTNFIEKSSNEDMKKGFIKEAIVTLEIDNGQERYGILLTQPSKNSSLLEFLNTK